MLGALVAIGVLIVLGALRDTLFPRRPGGTRQAELDRMDKADRRFAEKVRKHPEYFRHEEIDDDE